MDGKKDWVNFKALKQSVTMEQLLNRYGLLNKLKRKGSNVTGTCPIHKGSNPSQFHVSLTKNNFYCFGNCKSGWNIFDSVMQMEGVPLREAGLLLQRWFDLSPAGATSANVPDQVERNVPEPVEEDIKNVNTPLSFLLRSLDPSHPYLIFPGGRRRGLFIF